MKMEKDRIPAEVLKEIFPEKLNGRRKIPEELYTYLREMILSWKLKKGQKLTHKDIYDRFNVSRRIFYKVISPG